MDLDPIRYEDLTFDELEIRLKPIAVKHGSQVDDGTAWEIGYFYARKSSEQKIIGIRTDFRRAGECEGAIVDPIIECSCDKIVRIRAELMETISLFF